MIEGGQVEVEEVVGVDLSFRVPKKYEKLESCGNAAKFLLGIEMERDPPGREEVEVDHHTEQPDEVYSKKDSVPSIATNGCKHFDSFSSTISCTVCQTHSITILSNRLNANLHRDRLHDILIS